MKDMKNRVWRAISAVAMREHWRVRRVLLLVMVAVTALSMVTVKSMGDTVQPRRVYVVLTEDGRTEIISGRPSRDKSFGILETRVDYNAREAQLLLQHGHDMTVTSGEKSRTVQTRSETVDHLLHRLHMEPADDEMVFIDFTGDTPSIYFRTEMTRQRTVQLSVGYSSRRVVNHALAKGTERVMQQGVPGTITNTYTDTYRMGCVVSTELTDTVTDGAVEEVVEYGTRVTSVDRSDQLVSVHSNGDGSGYLLFASGDTMTFSRTLVCSATAYSIGTRTASGRPTAVGNIAVDTSVFPYGTRMYVQTVKGSWHYGMATAADCGTAIKGNKIDLWFKTFSEGLHRVRPGLTEQQNRETAKSTDARHRCFFMQTGTFGVPGTYIGLCSNGWRRFDGPEGNDGAIEAGPGGLAGGNAVPGRTDAAAAAVRQRRGADFAAGGPPGCGGRCRGHEPDAPGHYEQPTGGGPGAAYRREPAKIGKEGRQCRSWRKN